MDINEKRTHHIACLERYPVAETDNDPSVSGVLLSDRIIHYVDTCKMIQPFDPDALKAAGYELSIGNEFSVGGEGYSFDSPDPPKHIEIPPFEVAIIKTKEILHLPRFVIARWNLRVRWAYDGLLWIGAAQVDPGFTGNLYCPIYNLSDRPVILQQGERIALIDFVKTTPFIEDRSKRYPRPSKRDRNIFEDYNFQKLRSALITHAQQRIEDAVGEVEELRRTQIWFTTIIVTIIAVSVTVALSLSTSLGEQVSPDFWLVAITFGSLFAFLISLMFVGSMRFKSLSSVIRRKLHGRNADALKQDIVREWKVSFLALPALAFLSAMFGYFVAANLDYPAEENIEKIRQSVTTLQSELSELKQKMNTNAAD